MNVYATLILVAAAWISLFFSGIYLVGFIKALCDDCYFSLSSALIFIVCCIIAAVDVLFLCCH